MIFNYARDEKLKRISFASIKGRTWSERERSIEGILRRSLQKNEGHLHLVYDRRIHKTKRPVSENHLLLEMPILQCCAKVTIINEDGTKEVIKSRSGA